MAAFSTLKLICYVCHRSSITHSFINQFSTHWAHYCILSAMLCVSHIYLSLWTYIIFFKNGTLHLCDWENVLLFEPGPNMKSPLRQRAESLLILISKPLFRLKFGHCLCKNHLFLNLKYFHCHSSPVLNAICHVGKSPGLFLMTGKCFQEIQPSFSALTLQGN